MQGGEPLACPRCAARYALDERFCASCGMPLVYVGRDHEDPSTGAHAEARKIKPQYARGELVRAGTGRNQAEAELMKGMLLEEGIPSMLRRTAGFDVPDFLAAGPRDVLVPASALEAARQLLGGDPPPEPDPADLQRGGSGRAFAYLLVAFGLAVVIVWLFYQAST